ncbi:hypothetical protein, partial [Bilophila wadsworthia]|uniref:rhamnogalacturonan lyase family protein n=1 Tax=Bilophila wadsworthia TaxID=35833 RepID=UPI003AB8B8F3
MLKRIRPFYRTLRQKASPLEGGKTGGSCAIDHNGKGLYTTKMGHGDAIHLTHF